MAGAIVVGLLILVWVYRPSKNKVADDVIVEKGFLGAGYGDTSSVDDDETIHDFPVGDDENHMGSVVSGDDRMSVSNEPMDDENPFGDDENHMGTIASGDDRMSAKNEPMDDENPFGASHQDVTSPVDDTPMDAVEHSADSLAVPVTPLPNSPAPKKQEPQPTKLTVPPPIFIPQKHLTHKTSNILLMANESYKPIDESHLEFKKGDFISFNPSEPKRRSSLSQSPVPLVQAQNLRTGVIADLPASVVDEYFYDPTEDYD